MPTREQWKKVYAAAHFGCLVSWFALFMAPVTAVGAAPPGMRLRAVATALAITFGFAVICAVVGNIASRKSE